VSTLVACSIVVSHDMNHKIKLPKYASITKSLLSLFLKQIKKLTTFASRACQQLPLNICHSAQFADDWT
jgi:hypothetical protein